MANLAFNPEKAVGKELLQMGRQELCLFVSRLCLHLKGEVGSRAWRGGIFPENICTDWKGGFALGPAKREKWSGQELEFVAPELYWHGETSPAADVYSLGLLLYYGLGGGKLPFETTSVSGQLARMSGKTLPAPKAAGKRLGEVLEKATAFRPEDRYQTPEELQIMLESCLDNKYLGADGPESLFGREEGELSEIERMMVGIMKQSGDEEQGEEETPQPEPEPENLSPEERAGLEKPDPQPVEQENVAAMVEEFFGSLNKKEEQQEEEEAEDVRVYEPSKEKKDRQPIPILTEEKNPELAPVVLKSHGFVRSRPPQTEEEKVAEEVRKRRNLRPLAVVLALCVLLVVGAVMANALLNQSARSRLIAANAGNPTPDPSALVNPEGGAVLLPEEATDLSQLPEEEAQTPETALPRYVVTVGDESWVEAQTACREQGGYLAVISTREEFDEITRLADEQGITRLWIGCHRVDDPLAWEKDEAVYFSNWAENEPSYWDYWDGVAEDYVMLYKDGGSWFYNDNRNDPAADYPEYYSGTMGYVCEYDR